MAFDGATFTDPNASRIRYRTAKPGKCLKAITHSIRAPLDSALGQAILRTENSMSVCWFSTANDVIHADVNSRGVKRLRAAMAEVR